jgi:transcriptional regulator with PAS, ATPase and Fis domain
MTQGMIDQLDCSVMLCDTKGILVYMNEKCAEQYRDRGGRKMIGKDILECHPEPARSKLMELLATEQENIYTIEKNGVKKIIIQKPWRENGVFKGMAEFSIILPEGMPHFIR